MPFFPTHINNQSVKPIVGESVQEELSYYSSALSLEKHLVPSPASTYYAEVEGSKGDILIVDKSVEPLDGMSVVAYINGEFILKSYSIIDGKAMLTAEDSAAIEPNETNTIWGVVRYYIKKL